MNTVLDVVDGKDCLTDEPLKKKLIHNGFWLYFFAFLAAPAGYIAKVLVSRELAVEDIGLFYSILGIISLLATYNDLGLTEALQYFLPHYLIDKEYGKAKAILISTFYIQLLTGLLVGGLTFFMAPRLASHYFKSSAATPILQVFSIYYLILNFFQVLQSIFIATQKVKRSQGVEAIRMWGIVLFICVGLFIDTFLLIDYAIFFLLGITLATIVCIIGVYKYFSWIWGYKAEFNKKLFYKQRSYAFWIMIGSNVTFLLSTIDQQLALYVFGTKSAGYRTNYLSLLNLSHIISAPIIGYLFPLLNELYKKQQYDKIKTINLLLYGGFTLLGIMIGIVFYIGGPNIATFFFGSNFLESGILLQKSAPFVFLIPLLAILFQNLASRGQVKQRLVVLTLGVIVNVIFSFLFIKYFQLYGIIYGTVCGQIIMILSSIYVIRSKKYLHN